LGGEHKFSVSAKDFFLNCTWSAHGNSTEKCPDDLLSSWLDDDEENHLDIFTVLSCFTSVFVGLYTFIQSHLFSSSSSPLFQ
jgi:hypothetical protein